MANSNTPFGFRPATSNVGGEIRTSSHILKTGSTAYKGDLLSVDATGTVTPSTANDGSKIIGVAAEYVSDSGSAGGKTILVYDDPRQEFVVQVDATGTAIVAADMYSVANHVAGAGNATNKLSGHQWNQASIAGAANKDLKFIRIIDTPDNVYGAYAKIVVVLNNHFYANGSNGI